MLLMVELFHYFSYKVCLLGLLVNMYIFELSKTYNKSLFPAFIYNLTLIFQSFVKYFHEEIPVAAMFFLVFVIVIGSRLRGDGNEFRKKKDVFVQKK